MHSPRASATVDSRRRWTIPYTIVARSARGDGCIDFLAVAYPAGMSPTWIWMQIAIVVFVLIGMIIAITKLA
jgi:hypothetical protein